MRLFTLGPCHRRKLRITEQFPRIRDSYFMQENPRGQRRNHESTNYSTVSNRLFSFSASGFTEPSARLPPEPTNSAAPSPPWPQRKETHPFGSLRLTKAPIVPRRGSSCLKKRFSIRQTRLTQRNRVNKFSTAEEYIARGTSSIRPSGSTPRANRVRDKPRSCSIGAHTFLFITIIFIVVTSIIIIVFVL